MLVAPNFIEIRKWHLPVKKTLDLIFCITNFKAIFVADIFLTWSDLMNPRTDQDFIKFVTSIENGVSCLRSLGHEKELEFSFMSVTMEKKLDERMQKQFLEEYTIGMV